MKKSVNILKVFAISVFSLIFVITFYYGSSYAYDYFKKEVLGEELKYAANTKVGPVNVSGLNRSEAKKLLRDKVNEWSQRATITVLNREGKEIKIPSSLFTIDVNRTVNAIKDGRANAFIVLAPNVTETIGEDFQTDIYLDIALIQEELLLHVQQLEEKITVDGNNFTISEDSAVVAESVVTNYKRDRHLQKWLNALNNIVISANETTSLLTMLSKNENTPIASESLNVVATGLYKAILKTNFTIIERHISRSIPSYASLGYEAKVVPNEMDFAFHNPNEDNYVLQIREEKNTLYVNIIGPGLPFQYIPSITDRRQFNPKTIVHFSEEVEAGESVVQNEGQPGYLGNVIRKVFDINNKLVETTIIAEDFYPPVHRVELRYGKEGSRD
jgi:hypothetical protein